MCQFNFLVTKDKLKSSEIKQIASEYGLNYIKNELDITNSDKIWTFLTTSKSCDCGSVLGKKYVDNGILPDWNKERKKLERKRFSKRRIELLLAQKQKELAKKNTDELNVEQNESKKWTDFLNDERLKSKLNVIGILYHQFSVGLNDEQIKIENEKTNSLDKIDIDFLRNIKENELNWIKLK